MPKLFTCIHCCQPHTTAEECRDHEAECLWRIKSLNDPLLRACPTCGGLVTKDGRFCVPKGGCLISRPVTFCRWWSKSCTACENTGVAAEDGDTCPNCSGKRPADQTQGARA